MSDELEPDAPAATAHGHGDPDPAGNGDEAEDDDASDDLAHYAARARELGGADVGLAVRARPRTGDTALSIAISTPRGTRRLRRLVFLGRSRAALTSAATLLETLREDAPADLG